MHHDDGAAPVGGRLFNPSFLALSFLVVVAGILILWYDTRCSRAPRVTPWRSSPSA